MASYPRPRPHPRAHSWSTQMALATLGASSDVIQAYQAATNIEEKRRIFSNEMADLRHLEAQRLEPLQQRGVQGGVQRGIQRGDPAFSIHPGEARRRCIRQECPTRAGPVGSPRSSSRTERNRACSSSHGACGEGAEWHPFTAASHCSESPPCSQHPSTWFNACRPCSA